MFRSPPNKGRVEFPAVFHVRCTQAMAEEIRSRGGGPWVRSIVAANSRPPVDKPQVDPDQLPLPGVDVSPAIASDTRAPIGAPKRRVSRKGKSPGENRRRVSLDRKKPRRLKHHVSRPA